MECVNTKFANDLLSRMQFINLGLQAGIKVEADSVAFFCVHKHNGKHNILYVFLCAHVYVRLRVLTYYTEIFHLS